MIKEYRNTPHKHKTTVAKEGSDLDSISEITSPEPIGGTSIAESSETGSLENNPTPLRRSCRNRIKPNYEQYNSIPK